MELQPALYPLHPTLQLVFNDAEPAEPDVDAAVPMPFRDRFDTLHVTPQNIADTVVEEDGSTAGFPSRWPSAPAPRRDRSCRSCSTR